MPARADTWPGKPVQIVVPFAPGGSGDITARLIGKYMEGKTGQPFVVENKAGANGIVGVISVNAWNDLYADSIQFVCVDLTAARGQVVARKAKPLAISLAERSPLYPDVPTFGESFPGLVRSTRRCSLRTSTSA